MLSVQLVLLYHLGMVREDKVLKDFSKPWIFMTFFECQKCEKTWNCRMNMVWFWSPELSTRAKWSPKKSQKNSGGSSEINLKSRGLSNIFEDVSGCGYAGIIFYDKILIYYIISTLETIFILFYWIMETKIMTLKAPPLVYTLSYSLVVI